LNATVIRDLTLSGGRGDLAFADGLIGAAPLEGATEIDGSGYIAIPRLTDCHLHLDKTLLGDRWQPHRSGGTIADRIRLEVEALASPELDFRAGRAARAAGRG
jgi:cytosine/adenosine deaminase-related metal-dependent hydrolase